VVIAIIAVLAALLFPALSRAKASAQITQCRNNEHQMGVALAVYHGDADGYPLGEFPNPNGNYFEWSDQLSSYVGNTKWGDGVFKCSSYRSQVTFPTNRGYVLGSYAYNSYGFVAASVFPSDPRFVIPSKGLGGAMDEFTGAISATKESIIKIPSDMYALGDSVLLWKASPFSDLTGGLNYFPGDPFSLTNAGFMRIGNIVQHTRGYNMAFVDAHVEFVRADKLFSPEKAFWRRWNVDHWAFGDPF
jgi:prepilin-type processing-associated H-X9-DG protein